MSLDYNYVFSQIDKAKKKRWTQADTVVTTTIIVAVNASTLRLQSAEKEPDVIQFRTCIMIVFAPSKYCKKIIQERKVDIVSNNVVTSCDIRS